MENSERWHEEVLFFSGDQCFADQLDHIARAQKTIELESYIFMGDEIGHQFEAALLAAHRRGVKVRMLVDGFGSLEWINTRYNLLRDAGLNVRIYHPILLVNQILQQELRWETLAKLSERGSSLNRRNHRKCCIVDGEVAWVGSMNVTKVHSMRFFPDKGWRDTAIRVRGHIEPLQQGFDYIWKQGSDPTEWKVWKPRFLHSNSSTPSSLVRSNYTYNMRKKGYTELMERIDKAEKRIYITTAYLAPSLRFIRLLGKAARRGVDVKVLLPRISDVVFMPWIARSFYKDLLDNGVDIYEFLPCVLHAKSIVIDDWAMVGSTNLNGRSLQRDLEVDVVLSHKESIEELSAQFKKDLSHSEKIKSSEEGVTDVAGRWLLRTFRNWI